MVKNPVSTGPAGGVSALRFSKRVPPVAWAKPFGRSGAAKKQKKGVETRELLRREADRRIGRGEKARHAQSSSLAAMRAGFQAKAE